MILKPKKPPKYTDFVCLRGKERCLKKRDRTEEEGTEGKGEIQASLMEVFLLH